MRHLIIAILIYFSFLLQTAILPALDLSQWGFNFLLLLLCSLAVFRPRGEVIFWAAVIGLVIDSLSVLPLQISVFVIPALAFLSYSLNKKIWVKPGIFPFLLLTVLTLTLFNVFVLLLKTSIFPKENSYWGILIENLPSFASALARSLIVNSIFLVPLFYYLFKKLNELFEYWQQRKKI